MADPSFIKTPVLLILDTFAGRRPIIQIPLLIWHCQENVFQNRGVPCNYLVREEGMKRQIFGLMYRGVRL